MNMIELSKVVRQLKFIPKHYCNNVLDNQEITD